MTYPLLAALALAAAAYPAADREPRGGAPLPVPDPGPTPPRELPAVIPARTLRRRERQAAKAGGR